jgi:mRNA interferase HigB
MKVLSTFGFHAHLFNMVIISFSTIRAYSLQYPDAEKALLSWFETALDADWSNFHDVKNTFNSVDAVGNDRYVFNVKGNKYRLVALILFRIRTMYILFIGTHKAYDKIDASQIQFQK